MSLSKNLKILRNCKGLTQEEVSKDLHMNRATYAHYETGRREPDVTMLKILADYFDVTTDELLGEYNSINKNDTFNMENALGKRIKFLREEKELTQEEFGKLFGIVKSTVSLYESGKSTPDDEIKKKIAEYFNVSLDYLMGASNIKNPYNKEELKEKYPDVHDVEEAMKIILQQPGLMLKGELLSDESKIILANAIQMGLRTAEELEKKKNAKGDGNEQ